MASLPLKVLEHLQSFLQYFGVLKLYRVIKNMRFFWGHCKAIFTCTLFVYRRCKDSEANFCELGVTCIFVMLASWRQDVGEWVASESCHALVLMSIRCHSVLLGLQEKSLQLVVKSRVDLNGVIGIQNWSWRSSGDILPWPMKRHLSC